MNSINLTLIAPVKPLAVVQAGSTNAVDWFDIQPDTTVAEVLAVLGLAPNSVVGISGIPFEKLQLSPADTLWEWVSMTSYLIVSAWNVTPAWMFEAATLEGMNSVLPSSSSFGAEGLDVVH